LIWNEYPFILRGLLQEKGILDLNDVELSMIMLESLFFRSFHWGDACSGSITIYSFVEYLDLFMTARFKYSKLWVPFAKRSYFWCQINL
jgi:hypothetical protein